MSGWWCNRHSRDRNQQCSNAHMLSLVGGSIARLRSQWQKARGAPKQRSREVTREQQLGIAESATVDMQMRANLHNSTPRNLLSSVLRDMPSNAAARVLLPRQVSSAARMCASSSSLVPTNEYRTAGGGKDGGACAVGTCVQKRLTAIAAAWRSSKARSSAFDNSRTLPGHACCCSCTTVSVGSSRGSR